MSRPTDIWQAEQYLKFDDLRDRPFFDLVRRVEAIAPDLVVDLGCGTGHLTGALADRWSGARIVGVDSSADMLVRAAAHARGGAHTRDGTVEFVLGDLTTWAPDGPVDVLVSNAALHWVPDHVEHFDRWLAWLRPGGWFAFQVPGNFTAPSHRLLAELRRSARWRDQVGTGADRHVAVLDPVDYCDALSRRGCAVDAWETTYVQVMPGPDPVLEWMKGTTLRPVLAALSPAEADEFGDQLAALLREAYPPRAYGTLFPFRRIFVVARTPG